MASIITEENLATCPPGHYTRVTGLWLRETDGEAILFGKSQVSIPRGSNLYLVRNGQKTTNEQPDYVLLCGFSREDATPKDDDPAVETGEKVL